MVVGIMCTGLFNVTGIFTKGIPSQYPMLGATLTQISLVF